MLGRLLDHHIRERDFSYGPRIVTLRATIRKYAAKLLALMMMVVIGLWMCHGEGRQRDKQPKDRLQYFLFSEEEAGTEQVFPLKMMNHDLADALDLCWPTAVGELLLVIWQSVWSGPLTHHPAKVDLRHELLTEP